MAADIISSTTQQFLDIHDIVNNFIIMKDGTVSVIITVDAMNFGLLAEEEQDAVMYAYAGLLNSLNYPIQIVVNSQTKDVTSYLHLLKDQEESASNETIRRRIKQYREFVTNLIHDRNVLDKKFYVVIPANSIELGFAGAKSVLPGQSKFDISSIERSVLLEKAQNILDPRRDHLITQFARIGLFSRQLTTQEIIQLFYIRYNPEAAEGQQIAESSSYSSPLVEASIQGNVMNTDTIVPPAVAANAPGMQPTPSVQEAAPMPTAAAPQPPMVDPTISPATTPEATAGMVATAPQSATAEPTTTTPGSESPLDSISNVLTQPSVQAPAAEPTPPSPAAIPAQESASLSPSPAAETSTTTPTVPPVTPPLTPSAPPLSTEAPAQVSSTTAVDPTLPSITTEQATTTVSDNELDVQADLDETVKQLGMDVSANTGTDASSPAPAPTSPSAAAPLSAPNISSDTTQTPAPDLPPLPEI